MNNNLLKNRHGISGILIVSVAILIVALAFIGWAVAEKKEKNEEGNHPTPVVMTQAPVRSTPAPVIATEPPVMNTPNATNTMTTAAPTAATLQWTYEGNAWKSSTTPPECGNPLLSISPVDMSKVTAILYPGQTRGQYKAHGGFHFRNNKTNDVTVKMPIDGRITSAVRYYQTMDNGVNELQYLVTFLNDCGVSIKFDHLLTLSPELQTIMNAQPEAKLNDTGSLGIQNGRLFKQGDVVATAIGQKSNKSVGMDFGVYDYRQKNTASKNPTYAKAHASAAYNDFYATCWLNDLPAKDSAIAKSLPGGDGKAGKTSDYCK